MSNVYAVIMAGGSGTRFWPRSRAAWPKQFLVIGHGDDSLLQRTVARIEALIPPERVFVVTNERHVEATRKQLPRVPADQILGEPAGRNTAPCVAWGPAHVRRRDPDAIIAVLPADPHIGDEARYLDVLRAAINAASGDALVTIGITPDRPETGYGYIELGDAISGTTRTAKRFVEKPDRATAESYVASGRFLWNSGMFFFRVDAINRAIAQHLPVLTDAMKRYDAAATLGREAELVAQTYASLPSISFDHGVMEKADKILVVPGEFGWDDVGHWASAWELADKDARGNAAPESSVVIDSDNCYVQSDLGKTADGRIIALVGVRDLIVVDTQDALLVIPRERAQDVRDVIAELKRRKQDKHL
jgi:mannose-1-phosphate guanylyltransferase